MKSQSRSIEEIRKVLAGAFPSLRRSDLQKKPHREWVELRTKLPLLLADDVVTLLPFVLLHLAETAKQSWLEKGDFVVYFLDVPLEPQVFPAENDRAMMRSDDKAFRSTGTEHARPRPTPKKNRQVQRKERDSYLESREDSFSKLNSSQVAAVYAWLRYVAALPNFNRGLGQRQLLSALQYWSKRSDANNGTRPNMK